MVQKSTYHELKENCNLNDRYYTAIINHFKLILDEFNDIPSLDDKPLDLLNTYSSNIDILLNRLSKSPINVYEYVENIYNNIKKLQNGMQKCNDRLDSLTKQNTLLSDIFTKIYNDESMKKNLTPDIIRQMDEFENTYNA